MATYYFVLWFAVLSVVSQVVSVKMMEIGGDLEEMMQEIGGYNYDISMDKIQEISSLLDKMEQGATDQEVKDLRERVLAEVKDHLKIDLEELHTLHRRNQAVLVAVAVCVLIALFGRTLSWQ